MTAPRFRIQGHAVNPVVLYGAQWALGVFGVVWAAGMGAFIVFGGSERMSGQRFAPLLAAFLDYRLIGAVLAVGGILGVLGLGFDQRWVSAASAAICGGWNGMFALYVIPANWSIPGGGNLVGGFAVLAMVVFFVRIPLLFLSAGPADVTVKM